MVLGISFLRIKMKLAERIVIEQENADIDVLTGCPNRRRYMEDLKKINGGQKQSDLIYLVTEDKKWKFSLHNTCTSQNFIEVPRDNHSMDPNFRIVKKECCK